MLFRYNFAIDIYSLAILLFVLAYSRQASYRRQTTFRLFQSMTVITIILLVGDLLSWLDGVPGPVWGSLVHIGNFLMFAFNTVVPSLYVMYVYEQIHRNGRSIKVWGLPLLVTYLVNSILVFTNPLTGWFYTIGTDNVYARGPLYAYSLIQFGILIVIAVVLAIRNRHLLERRTFWALVVFPIPPVIAVVLQTAMYGMSLIMHGLTFSLLIIFLQIQNHTLHTDHLTGVYNRKKLEGHLRDRIAMAAGKGGFSAIMIDLDNFKRINDMHGHAAGDKVLIDAARILQTAMRKEDLVARYGGDEFVVLLDAMEPRTLQNAIDRIQSGLAAYNLQRDAPYQLEFSMGYACYQPDEPLTADAFQMKLDCLMYEEKTRKKTQQMEA